MRRSCFRLMKQHMLVSDQTMEPNMMPINRATDGNEANTRDGTPHPIGKLAFFSTPLLQLTFGSAAWYQDKCAGADSTAELVGRSWYSSLGHRNETWQVGRPHPHPSPPFSPLLCPTRVTRAVEADTRSIRMKPFSHTYSVE